MFEDPENKKEILEKMRNLPTLGEIKKLVDDTYPNWIVTVMKDYSPDYPHLTENWKQMCEKKGVRPTQVLIVKDLFFDNDHELIQRFADCFTLAGFSVRPQYHYIPCEKCGLAVPVENMWKMFRERELSYPEVWNSTCSGC